ADSNIAHYEGLKRALEAGVGVLKTGGSSLDAVEAAIRVMEDDPVFNAGRGAVLNARGEAELDASIMDGRTRKCGAVASATRTRHPITVARLVMEKTRHVLLGAEGVDAFAIRQGAERVERAWFVTERQRRRLERLQKKSGALSPEEILAGRIGTVGCVALDASGNLAAGTSTGGLVNKLHGRIGDSPIVGAGTYADNATCAVSGTGIGEEFIRHAVAYDVSARMKYAEQTVTQAVGTILRDTLKPNQGGLIAVDREGTVVMDFNTGGMACAAADASGRFEIRWPRGLPEK
ncbi:MAG: isoaspartyl peptidase/L-asparaginase, partial [Akkermansiaceae bacterium]|nr:isoaspartyl peptidase/L-asparaginase [Akkermansiaceae bacterium]